MAKVSFSKTDVQIVDEDEPEPWWRCCCPAKKVDSRQRVTLERKRSVIKAQETLRRYSEAIAPETQLFIEPQYLPLTFVPDFILNEIFKDSLRILPYVITSKTVLLVADVCGFTSLCESYCQKGVSGVEELVNVLNGFMSTLSAMLIEGGGDILNFAGDAFLVQWLEEEPPDGMMKAVKRAYECAVALQTHQCLMSKNLNGTLKIKIGIAVGEIGSWILGSSGEFLLFVVAGQAIPFVQKAEDMCAAGEIVVSKEAFDLLKGTEVETFTTTEMDQGFVKVSGYTTGEDGGEPIPNRVKLFEQSNKEHLAMAKIFLIPGLRGLKSAVELEYVSELTMVTILFIALLNVEIEEPKVLDSTFDIILASCGTFEGVLNKMLLFDKGCTFLVIFGLPGNKHSNDAARGINCAEDVKEKLQNLNIQVSVGISSGTCFCGIVGHPQRQEYTGAHVNMAARIMVVYNDEPIALNVDTYHLSRDELEHSNFVELPARKMKGIDSAGAIYAYRKKVRRFAVLKSQATRLIQGCELLFRRPGRFAVLKAQDTRLTRGYRVAKQSEGSVTATYGMVEDSNLYGSEKEKLRIRQCVIAMKNDEDRAAMKEKTLLPVCIIKGQTSSGKSYLMFFATDVAVSLDYKVVVCCTIPSFCQEPFFVTSRLMQRMLRMTMNESYFEREQMLVSAVPSECYTDLYLLNHLFNVHFPNPGKTTVDVSYRNVQFMKIAKIIMHHFCENESTLIAIDNADYMDDQSWYLLHHLAEEERVLIVLSLSLKFREVNVSASSLLLKAYIQVNIESSQEDYFAPLLCWFLGVQAVHTKLFVFLKEVTDGKIQLLKEISLSPVTAQCMEIIPFASLDEERIKKEFYIDKFDVFKEDQPMACDLKHGVDLGQMMIPTNINDAVKESLNKLTIQDRLLLKRAAVLGVDFDQHTLESVSPGMKRSEVLESINNLLSHHVFSSVCTFENMLEATNSKISCLTLDKRNICYCFNVHLSMKLTKKNLTKWAIGPYHRLRFRTPEFRSCIIAYMTKDQLYTMRMDVADNLELNGPECASCKSRRLEESAQEGYEEFQICMCLEKRAKIYMEISILYKSIGLMYLPTYFTRKAAQAANNINYPIQALNYIQLAEEMLPEYWNMSEEDKCKCREESYFDPIILDVSLKKSKAESFLLLGDTYSSATYSFHALEMLGLDVLCFHGVFNPKEFKNILPRFHLLHAECITKLIGLLARAYLKSGIYKLALDLLRIEYVALSGYPIDFLQVLHHMTALYECKYYFDEREKLPEIEDNIYKLCLEKINNFDALLDLTEILAIGETYIMIIQKNLSLANFLKAENTANEMIKILSSINDRTIIPKIKLLLGYIYFHSKKYLECFKCLMDLKEGAVKSKNQRILSMITVAVMHLIMKDPDVVTDHDVQIDNCSKFAFAWCLETSLTVQHDLAFYMSVSSALWCLHADKHLSWIRAKDSFKCCYEISVNLHKMTDKMRDNFWIISAIVLFMEIKLECIKDPDLPDQFNLQEEMSIWKHKIKSHYPIYWKTYQKLINDADADKPKH